MPVDNELKIDHLFSSDHNNDEARGGRSLEDLLANLRELRVVPTPVLDFRSEGEAIKFYVEYREGDKDDDSPPDDTSGYARLLPTDIPGSGGSEVDHDPEADSDYEIDEQFALAA
jgi:hypothetical protein